MIGLGRLNSYKICILIYICMYMYKYMYMYMYIGDISVGEKSCEYQRGVNLLFGHNIIKCTCDDALTVRPKQTNDMTQTIEKRKTKFLTFASEL